MNIFQKLFGTKLTVDLPSTKTIKFSASDSAKVRAEKILRSSGLVVNRNFCDLLDGASQAVEMYQKLDDEQKQIAIAGALADYGITDLVKKYREPVVKNSKTSKPSVTKKTVKKADKKTPPVLTIVPAIEPGENGRTETASKPKKPARTKSTKTTAPVAVVESATQPNKTTKNTTKPRKTRTESKTKPAE